MAIGVRTSEFLSNSSSFTLDKSAGSMVFRHDQDVQESDFHLVHYLSTSARLFPWLFDRFGQQSEEALVE
jgi:hypothetical protein